MSPESARPLRTATSIPGCQRSRSLASSGDERRANALRMPRTSSTRSGVVVPDGEVADRAVQRGGQRAAQVRLGPRLDLARPPAGADRQRAQLAEQHGLADPAQAGEHQAALGPPARDPLQHDLERVDLAVASGQLGRALTGSGSERVAHGIHASDGIGDSRRFRRSGYRRRWRVVDRGVSASLARAVESRIQCSSRCPIVVSAPLFEKFEKAVEETIWLAVRHGTGDRHRGIGLARAGGRPRGAAASATPAPVVTERPRWPSSARGWRRRRRPSGCAG